MGTEGHRPSVWSEIDHTGCATVVHCGRMTCLSFCGCLWVVHLTSTSRSPVHPQRLWETLGSRFEPLEEVGDLLVDLLPLTHLALDLLDGVNNRRVVTPTEKSGDARIAEIG